VARFAACDGQHREYILQGLLELRSECIRLEMLLRVPAHLAGRENDSPGVDRDAVGVADRRNQAVGQKKLQRKPAQSV
jgi:hypothetical protein